MTAAAKLLALALAFSAGTAVAAPESVAVQGKARAVA